MNGWYNSALGSFAGGDIDWDNDDIRVVLCNGYTADLTTDNALNDISAGNRVAVSSALTGKTSVAGALKAANYEFTNLTGSQVTAVVVYKHTGVESTSLLIRHFDRGANIPLTPDGSSWTLAFQNTIVGELSRP